MVLSLKPVAFNLHRLLACALLPSFLGISDIGHF